MKTRIEGLNDQIEKLKSDNISMNAKLNVQQQTMDSQRRMSIHLGNSTPIPPKSGKSIANITSKNVVDQENIADPKDISRRSIQKAEIHGSTDLESQLNNMVIDMGTLKLCIEEIRLHLE